MCSFNQYIYWASASSWWGITGETEAPAGLFLQLQPGLKTVHVLLGAFFSPWHVSYLGLINLQKQKKQEFNKLI